MFDPTRYPFLQKEFPQGLTIEQAEQHIVAELNFFGELRQPENAGLCIEPTFAARQITRSTSQWLSSVFSGIVTPLRDTKYSYSGTFGSQLTQSVTRTLTGATTDKAFIAELESHLEQLAAATEELAQRIPGQAAQLKKKAQECQEGLKAYCKTYKNKYNATGNKIYDDNCKMIQHKAIERFNSACHNISFVSGPKDKEISIANLDFCVIGGEKKRPTLHFHPQATIKKGKREAEKTETLNRSVERNPESYDKYIARHSTTNFEKLQTAATISLEKLEKAFKKECTSLCVSYLKQRYSEKKDVQATLNNHTEFLTHCFITVVAAQKERVINKELSPEQALEQIEELMTERLMSDNPRVDIFDRDCFALIADTLRTDKTLVDSNVETLVYNLKEGFWGPEEMRELRYNIIPNQEIDELQTHLKTVYSNLAYKNALRKFFTQRV